MLLFLVVLVKMPNLKTSFRAELEITVQRENGETQAQGAYPGQLGNFFNQNILMPNTLNYMKRPHL